MTGDGLLVELPEILKGPRVVLRPWSDPDAPALWEAVTASREHLAPWMPWAATYRAPADAVAYVRRARAEWIMRETLAVGIFAGGRLLGGSGLHNIDWGIRRFEIGYWIRPDAQGQGYVAEAVRLLADLCFRQLGAVRAEIRADPRNVRSCNVALRAGFTLEATLRSAAAAVDGAARDVSVFALLAGDYWKRTPGPRPA